MTLHNNTRAIIYMVISTLFFVLMKVCVKALPRLPVSELIVLRSAFSFCCCYLVLRYQKVYPFPSGKQRKWLFLRAGLGCVGLWLYFYIIQRIPLASAYTLEYLLPVTLTLLSAWLLRERLMPRQWLFFALCLGGVISIHGVDFRIGLWDTVLGLLAMLCTACTFMVMRYLRHQVHPLVVIMSFPMIALPVFLPITLWEWVTPRGMEWVYLLLVGTMTQGAQYYAVRATFVAEDFSKVTIVGYLGMVFALLFGFIFFDETYSYKVYIGMGVVCLAVLGHYKYTASDKGKSADKEKIKAA